MYYRVSRQGNKKSENNNDNVVIESKKTKNVVTKEKIQKIKKVQKPKKEKTKEEIPQYRVNSKGERRKILLSIPLVSFTVLIILLYCLTDELYSAYYQVDMNDVIKNFDLQLSSNVMTQMNCNSFRYEIENLKLLDIDGKTGSRIVRSKDDPNLIVMDDIDELPFISVDVEYDEFDEYYNLVQKRKKDTQTSSNKTTNPTPVNKNNYVTSSGERYHIIANLKIPDLNIEYPILSSTSEELLKISLTKYWGSDPNKVGNMVVLGHNYESKQFFSKLHEIKNGAKIYLTDLDGKTLEYTVYDTQIIDPNDNSCTSQLTNGKTELTLITCYNRDKNRFVVKSRAN